MDYTDYINELVQTGPDMTAQPKPKQQTEYKPPVEGEVRLRFIGYVEVGKQKSNYDDSVKEKVKLIFECHGKNYPNNNRITITENLSSHEKSNLNKIFRAMRGNDNSVKHMAQMLGRPFKGRIVHHEFTGRDGSKRIYARLRDDNGYTIEQPLTEVRDEDGEVVGTKAMNVPEAVAKQRLFLWNFCDKKMWDSLFIEEGTYSNGNSKNVFQDEIMKAVNFKGSRIDRILNGQGGLLDDAKQEVQSTSKYKRQVQLQAVPDEDLFINWDEGIE